MMLRSPQSIISIKLVTYNFEYALLSVNEPDMNQIMNIVLNQQDTNNI